MLSDRQLYFVLAAIGFIFMIGVSFYLFNPNTNRLYYSTAKVLDNLRQAMPAWAKGDDATPTPTPLPGSQNN